MGARARSHRVSIVFEVIRDFGCDPRRVPPFLKTKTPVCHTRSRVSNILLHIRLSFNSAGR